MQHRQNVTGQNVTDKMSHRQIETQTKCHRTKFYMDKMPLDKILRMKCHTAKLPHRQNITGQNVADKISHRQNVARTKCRRK